MQKKIIIRWALLAMAVLPIACATPARTHYLRDLNYEEVLNARPAPELKLKPGDEVAIQVFSVDPDLAAPFNAGAGLSAGGALEASLSSDYLVDARGNIDFPVLGEIPVEGKTLTEVKKEIAGEISRKGYILEPVVKVELNNFTVTVLGNTGQSVMDVEGNSINILQLIAKAGGIAGETADLRDVMVVRTENGQRKAYSINLQKKELFDSPVFYLQQNDVVYVKPRGSRLSSDGDVFLKWFSPVASALSTVAYLVLWLSR